MYGMTAPASVQDLSDNINAMMVDCVNQSDRNTIGNLFPVGAATGNGMLESGVDPELIINVPFNQPCRLTGVLFRAPDNDQKPCHVKLFCNKRCGFEDMEDQATEEVDLDWTDADPPFAQALISLRPARWVHTACVSVAITSNTGGAPTTVLKSLLFLGQKKDAANAGTALGG